MDVTGAFNALLNLLPPWLSVALAIVGAAIVAWAVFRWFQKRSGGSGMQGFPAGPTIAGLILMLPAAILPLIGLILQAIINLVTVVIQQLVP